MSDLKRRVRGRDDEDETDERPSSKKRKSDSDRLQELVTEYGSRGYLRPSEVAFYESVKNERPDLMRDDPGFRGTYQLLASAARGGVDDAAVADMFYEASNVPSEAEDSARWMNDVVLVAFVLVNLKRNVERMRAASYPDVPQLADIAMVGRDMDFAAAAMFVDLLTGVPVAMPLSRAEMEASYPDALVEALRSNGVLRDDPKFSATAVEYAKGRGKGVTKQVGRFIWRLLHLSAEALAMKSDREMNADALTAEFRSYLRWGLQRHLYCGECVAEYTANVVPKFEKAIASTERVRLPSVIYRMHETVNERLGKSPYPDESFKRDRELMRRALVNFKKI